MDATELKISLMQFGAIFTRNARSLMYGVNARSVAYADYATTGGVVLVLDDHIYANVPPKYRGTPFRVDVAEGAMALYRDDARLNVKVGFCPVPQFAQDVTRLSDGTPVRELVMTHADRTRISPIFGCAYHCRFCSCNGNPHRELPIERLDEAFQIALRDKNIRPRHVLISGGTPRTERNSYEYLNRVYQFFPKYYPELDFDVMLSPRGLTPDSQDYLGFLHYLHDECGVKTLSINLELYNEKQRKDYIPEKAEIGKDNYFSFIRSAVQVFGKNSIRSSLVVGLEPIEDTLTGVERLCENGCIPVLSSFVPAIGTDMAAYPAPKVEFLTGLVHKASSIAQSYGTQLGPLCKPCTHNSITEEQYTNREQHDLQR